MMMGANQISPKEREKEKKERKIVGGRDGLSDSYGSEVLFGFSGFRYRIARMI